MIPRRALVALALPLALGACAATPPQPSSAGATSASPVASVVGGVPLRAFGITHGPENIWLPGSLLPTRTIDQTNVVTVFVHPSKADEVGSWLQQNLPRTGWTVDGAANGSILFHGEYQGQRWRGAWTAPTAGEKASLAGLTLRLER